MKKRTTVLFLLLCLLFCCGFDSAQQKVYDDAGLLTEEERDELQKEAVKLAPKIRMDVILVTTADTQGMSASDYNEYFYNTHSFGYEEPEGSGVQFLIDMEHREFFVLTAGIADRQYSDSEIEKIYDQITPSMKDGDYAEACRKFLEGASQYADHRITPDAEGIGRAFISSAVVSAVIVLIMAKVSKRKMGNTAKRSYRGTSLYMREQKDEFTHTTVVRKPVPKTSGTSGGRSGGGGGHSSGGGRSGGGGGHSRGGGRSF
ncbi:TPM domain-containing protein [Hominifimenecus sp. rT4P-3]|uniref:TPM domain-containing protein n=1 Tax=Hominifimenecus sp. rT4P-3 TaxID=3242979 RepID=UPI003DA5FD04